MGIQQRPLHFLKMGRHEHLAAKMSYLDAPIPRLGQFGDLLSRPTTRPGQIDLFLKPLR